MPVIDDKYEADGFADMLLKSNGSSQSMGLEIPRRQPCAGSSPVTSMIKRGLQEHQGTHQRTGVEEMRKELEENLEKEWKEEGFMTVKSQITEEYKYRTELHCHTLPVSSCSKVYADALVEAYKELGADTVVLTNHFTPEYIAGRTKAETIREYTECFHDLKKCAQKNGMTAVFGVEIRFSENNNDYLIYGIQEENLEDIYEFVNKGIECFYREFKDNRNLILQAHPFRNGMVLADLKSIDGIETFNMHPNHNSRVGLAVSYAREHNLLVSGGTDFHELGHQGCCFVRTKTKIEDSYDVANVLKSRDFVFDIFGNIILP